MHVYLEYLERTKPEVRVEMRIPVYLTEDPARVANKLADLFSWIQEFSQVSEKNGMIWLEHGVNDHKQNYGALKTLFRLFMMAQILDSARAHLLRKWRHPRFLVYFHKQAAMVHRLSFCDEMHESPLGTISLRIETTEPDIVLNGIAPRWEWIKPGGTPLPPDSPQVSMHSPKDAVFDDAKKKSKHR